MIECEPFRDIKWNSVVYDVLLVTCTPIGFICTYCIIFKSTKPMKTYKWFLLQYQLSSFLQDVVLYLTDLAVYFPFPLIFGTGYIARLPVKAHSCFALFMLFVVLILIALSLMLYYRLYILLPDDSRWKLGLKWNYITLAGIYLLIFGCFVTFLSSFSLPRTTYLSEMASNYTCLTHITNIKTMLGYPIEKMISWGLLFCVGIACIAAFNISVAVRTVHLLSDKTKFISKASLRAQRQFFYAALLQIIIPLIAVFCSLIAICVLIYYDVRSQDLYHLLVTLLSTHGTLASITIILFTEPYRTHVKYNILRFKRKKVSMISTTFVDVSRSRKTLQSEKTWSAL